MRARVESGVLEHTFDQAARLILAELATSATLVPLTHPGDAAPEPGYVPSKTLAHFVRCRDLICRWPGCDHPAYDCDLDHTIPHANGGPHPRALSTRPLRQVHTANILTRTFMRSLSLSITPTAQTPFGGMASLRVDHLASPR